jgi:hypothetical protein
VFALVDARSEIAVDGDMRIVGDDGRIASIRVHPQLRGRLGECEATNEGDDDPGTLRSDRRSGRDVRLTREA